MNDEVLQPTESTDGQMTGMDALQESINAMLGGDSAASAGHQDAEAIEEKPPVLTGTSAINMLDGRQPVVHG